ncbi:MAG: arsenate reductase ArsC [Woeseia sp.]
MRDQSAPVNVLFLCTGNSARSILGEALVNGMGAPAFRGYSAGSKPTGTVNPGAIKVLEAAGYDTRPLASKSWDVFVTGPSIDIVITACDNAAGEACPLFPGKGMRVHWGIPDPAGAANEDVAFARAFDVMRRRVARLIELPVRRLQPRELRAALATIRDQEAY